MNYEFLTKIDPSFESILALKEMEINFSEALFLLKKYRDEIKNDIEEFLETDNYLYCIRTINLFNTFKNKDAYYIAFDILENLTEDEEELIDTCFLYLEEMTNSNDGAYLYTKWIEGETKNLLTEDLVFELLLISRFENYEVEDYALDIIKDSDEIELKIAIANRSENPKFKTAIENRLKHIAPMAKYISAPPEINYCKEEFFELGKAFLRNKNTTPAIQSLENEDEIFLTSILGHTDPRMLKIFEKRIKSIIKQNNETKNQDTVEFDLKTKFFDELPDNLEEWINSNDVYDEHKKYFIDEKALILGLMNPKLKQNRNDLCECDSGKKFKKCCLKNSSF